MRGEWQYQLRIDLRDEFAEMARRNPNDPAVRPLSDVLTLHDAVLQCQFDAFAGYVAEAERHGTENYPLYEWTKATIENPAKEAKYVRSFAVHVGGQEVYAKEKADALEADLGHLVGGTIVTRLSRHDTNPAHNPQPPAPRRK